MPDQTKTTGSTFDSFLDEEGIREEVDASACKAVADAAWNTFVASAKAFAPHLDQWEKIKIQTEYGTVYVTISRSDPYPNSFEEVSNG